MPRLRTNVLWVRQIREKKIQTEEEGKGDRGKLNHEKVGMSLIKITDARRGTGLGR